MKWILAAILLAAPCYAAEWEDENLKWFDSHWVLAKQSLRCETNEDWNTLKGVHPDSARFIASFWWVRTQMGTAEFRDHLAARASRNITKEQQEARVAEVEKEMMFARVSYLFDNARTIDEMISKKLRSIQQIGAEIDRQVSPASDDAIKKRMAELQAIRDEYFRKNGYLREKPEGKAP